MRPVVIDASKPSLLVRWGLLVSYVLLVTFNALSSAGYLGPSQADVSGKWQTSLVPAGYAFSIWGVIFALQGAASLYAAVDMGYQVPGKSAAVNAVALGWPLAWLFETAWLLVFPRQTTLTFYLSAVLLFCGLGAIGMTVGRTHALTQHADASVRPNQLLWLLFVLPTSMNAAWMSVASCLGLDVLAVSQGLPAGNELNLAATLAVIVAAIGAAIILVYRDVAWGLVLIWAFAAVLAAHPHLMLIRTLSVIAITICGLCSAYVAVRYWGNRRSAWLEAAAARRAAGGPGGLQEALIASTAADEPAGARGGMAV